MAVTGVSLVDPTSGLTAVLKPADGITVNGIDASAPARAVVESRVGARGGVDRTQNLDEGVCSVTLQLYPGVINPAVTPEGVMDSIGPLLDPGLRPYLVVTNDAWAGQRRMGVRFDSKAAPWDNPASWPVQLNFGVPDSCWEDVNATSVVINAFIASSTGLVVDVPGLVVTSAGVVMPATSAVPATQVISAGTVKSQWQCLMYGPCTGPKLSNDVTGLTLEFSDDLSLAAGEYVLLSSQDESALLNGDPGSDVSGSLNFTTSDWWLIQAGLNVIRYYPTSADAGSQAVLSFRGAYPL